MQLISLLAGWVTFHHCMNSLLGHCLVCLGPVLCLRLSSYQLFPPHPIPNNEQQSPEQHPYI